MSPTEAREGARFRLEQARREQRRERREEARIVRAARGGAEGPLEGQVRTGAPILGPGGRIIGRTPRQVMRGGQWVNVGDTTVTTHVHPAPGMDEEAMGRVAARETERVLDRRARQTLAALEGAGGGE